MKILSSKAIQEVDAKTITYNDMYSYELMEMAANAFFQYFSNKYYNVKENVVAIFSGPGNNGGDGAAVARMLHNEGYSVKLFIVCISSKLSKDCSINVDRAEKCGVNITKIFTPKQIPNLDGVDIVIDAIFGTGLSRPLNDLAKDVTEIINEAQKTVVSIDIPSGLFMDKQTLIAVKATETVTFQIPKLSLYLPLNNEFVGKVTIVDIGLSEKAINEADTDIYYLSESIVANNLKPLTKYTHKGVQGHTLVIGGSIGKMGSVVLASKAALKSGCGLVTAYVPQCGMNIVQCAFPEAMTIQDKSQNHISSILYDIKPNAVAIGVGMGQHAETKNALKSFLENSSTPLVIDADALNILSNNLEWLHLLKHKAVLTPHPKELSRLVGKWSDDFEKIELTRQLARSYNLVVVVKGAHSLIIDSDNIYVNSSGTPALATAGSGDVLTGIIAGLLAQKYDPLVAAQIGVYIHGKTANITSDKINPRTFVASDIIENIGKAYDSLEIAANI